MSKYEVTTDKGVYEVETQDSNLMTLDEAKSQQATAEDNTSPLSIANQTVGGTAGYIGSRAGGILKGAVESVLHPVKTVKNTLELAGGVAQEIPFSTEGKILKNLPGAEDRKKMVEDVGRSIIEHPIDFATDTALTAGAGILGKALLSRAPGFIKSVGRGIEESKVKNVAKKEELASRLVNSSDKAVPKDIRIGDPGLGQAKEGITYSNPKQGLEKVNSKLDILNSHLNDAYSKSNTVILNTSKSLNPLIELRKKLMLSPEDNATSINRLDKIIRDVTGISTNNPRKYYMTPSETRGFKQYLADFADYELVGKGDNAINKAIKQSYHIVDDIIDNALPQTKQLNKRVTDLIAAKKILTKAVGKESVSPVFPGSVSDVMNAPFKFLRGPRVGTNLASMMVEKYPKNFKTQVFNKPLFQGENPSNLLSGKTKLLPSPKDVPYNPTGKAPGQRQPYSGFKTPSAPSTGKGIINLPDESLPQAITKLTPEQRLSVSSELKKQLQEFKSSKYAKDVQKSAKKKRLQDIVDALEGRENPYVDYLGG